MNYDKSIYERDDNGYMWKIDKIYTWKEPEHRMYLPYGMNIEHIYEVLLTIWNKIVKEEYKVSFTPVPYFDEKTNQDFEYLKQTIHVMLCEISRRKGLSREQERTWQYISDVWIKFWVNKEDIFV